MMFKFLNVSETAEKIGCTEGRVRQMLRNGEIKGLKANGRAWLVDAKEAARVAKVQHGTGRPRNSQKQG